MMTLNVSTTPTVIIISTDNNWSTKREMLLVTAVR